MRLKLSIILATASLFFACSDDSSSTKASEEVSLPTISETSPVVFTKLGYNKLLAGESFKLGFSGTISIDSESSKVEDGNESVIDSVVADARMVKEKDPSKSKLSKIVEAEYPTKTVPLNAFEILYDELEDCGTFRVYFWVYASSTVGNAYVALDSLDFEKEAEYCEESSEEVETPESSSSVLEECSSMEMNKVVLSTILSEQNRYVNFESGAVSSEGEGMQIALNLSGDMLTLSALNESVIVGEEYGNFRAGVIPEEVCAEVVEIYPGTSGNEIEIYQNAWIVVQENSKTYLVLIGKRTDGEEGSLVELTYWK